MKVCYAWIWFEHGKTSLEGLAVIADHLTEYNSLFIINPFLVDDENEAYIQEIAGWHRAAKRHRDSDGAWNISNQLAKDWL